MIATKLPKLSSFELVTGIYVHIPFCRRRCYYCDFPIKIVGESKAVQTTASQQYTEYLLKEVDATSQYINKQSSKLQTGAQVTIDSIYFGGGTPSLLDNQSIEKIISTLRRRFPVSEDLEISFEMDPGTFDSDRIQLLKEFGINRISLGIQSFDEKFLKLCGRAHTVQNIYDAMSALEAANFDNYNIDLISSLPHLDLDRWLFTLQEAIRLRPKHISVYDLQIEEKTAFGRWYTPGVFPLPSDEQARTFYTTAVDSLTKAGFEHYEVSNYAKPGHRSRHNQKYWKCSPTLGFGMGAASYLGGSRYTRPAKLEQYYQWVEQLEKDEQQLETVFGSNGRELQTRPDVLEVIMLSLRTADGLDLSALRSDYGEEVEAKVLKSVKPYIEDGSVIYQPQQLLRLKDPEGFIISNDIISTIFASL